MRLGTKLTCKPHPVHRAFTLVEMLIAVCLLGLVLAGLVNVAQGVRDRAKTEQAGALLRALERAQTAYVQRHGAWPRGAADGQARQALAALLGEPGARAALRSLDGPWSGLLDRPGEWLDPWGRPLRYVTELHDEAAVRMNGGRPFWVCAGPDRLFGNNPGDSAQADNISSDRPL